MLFEHFMKRKSKSKCQKLTHKLISMLNQLSRKISRKTLRKQDNNRCRKFITQGKRESIKIIRQKLPKVKELK